MIHAIEKIVLLFKWSSFSNPLNPDISKLRGKVNILGESLERIFLLEPSLVNSVSEAHAI